MVRKAIKRGLIVTVAVPVAAAVVRRISQALESRRGPSKASRLLRHAADTLRSGARRARPW